MYDALKYTEIDEGKLKQILAQSQPQDCQQIGEYRVYAIDTTPEERPEARTLPDRGVIRRDKDHSVQYGHKYSWLVRLVQWGTSWVAPVNTRRVETSMTNSQVALLQLSELEQQDRTKKVVVADSHYGNHFFLAGVSLLHTIFALVRLRNNQALYEQPAVKKPGGRGPNLKHGPKFKLAQPLRPAERNERFEILSNQTVQVEAWSGLHLKAIPQVVGTTVRIRFLRLDGTPRHKYPMWLFWTGPVATPLNDICRMYLWRFAIEHAFRFLKQHLGLAANNSTQLPNIEHWMWLCALAYWQLLLLRDVVDDTRPAWHPHWVKGLSRPLTPYHVQRAAWRYISRLGTPACSPKPRGIGLGRPFGFHPLPRDRYKTVIKGNRPP